MADVDAPKAGTEDDLEAKKAAKRKEIEEKLAALKLQQAKEATQKTQFFGEHGDAHLAAKSMRAWVYPSA